MFGAIGDIYTNINDGDIGLTGIIPLYKIEKIWFWTNVEPYRSEWIRLLSFVTNGYQYKSTPIASLGPGLCFPKSFLEKYSELYLPELCHDEIRIPIVSQLFGYQIKDTGFFKDWFIHEERKYFNADKIKIEKEIIQSELMTGYRRVFHPYNEIFDYCHILQNVNYNKLYANF